MGGVTEGEEAPTRRPLGGGSGREREGGIAGCIRSLVA